jgi:hypothetical protein
MDKVRSSVPVDGHVIGLFDRAVTLAAHQIGDRVERRLPITVRCRHCREVGRLQVRPPMPTRVGAIGWVMPGTADQIPCDVLPERTSRHGTEGII